MRRPTSFLVRCAALAAALTFAACGESGPANTPTSSRQFRQGDASPEGHAHVHHAPHGGTLVVLADEALNVELLVDVATGGLTAWVLDGEAENPVRIAQESIELTLDIGGTAQSIRLDAVANDLTGEKKGDTSQFAGRSDSLRGVGAFSGTLGNVTVGTRAFQSVTFRYAGQHR